MASYGQGSSVPTRNFSRPGRNESQLSDAAQSSPIPRSKLTKAIPSGTASTQHGSASTPRPSKTRRFLSSLFGRDSSKTDPPRQALVALSTRRSTVAHSQVEIRRSQRQRPETLPQYPAETSHEAYRTPAADRVAAVTREAILKLDNARTQQNPAGTGKSSQPRGLPLKLDVAAAQRKEPEVITPAPSTTRPAPRNVRTKTVSWSRSVMKTVTTQKLIRGDVIEQTSLETVVLFDGSEPPSLSNIVVRSRDATGIPRPPAHLPTIYIGTSLTSRPGSRDLNAPLKSALKKTRVLKREELSEEAYDSLKAIAGGKHLSRRNLVADAQTAEEILERSTEKAETHFQSKEMRRARHMQRRSGEMAVGIDSQQMPAVAGTAG